MDEDLRAHFAAAQAIVAIAADRVQWSVRDPVSPSIALHLIDAPADRGLKGSSGLVIARVQADCWAETFLAAKALGLALAASLPAQGQTVGSTKFLNCAVIDTDRTREGNSPNVLFRTRLDLRVSFHQA